MQILSTDGEILYKIDGIQAEQNGKRKILYNLDFNDCDLPNADLNDIVFRTGNLVDCNFKRSQFKAAIFEGVSIFGTCFEIGDLRDAEFYLVLALGASFHKADLRGAKFFGGSFEDVDFSEANLSQARFGRDNLGGETVLYGANFRAATFDETEFDGCFYNATTIFPHGFFPNEHGLVYRS